MILEQWVRSYVHSTYGSSAIDKNGRLDPPLFKQLILGKTPKGYPKLTVQTVRRMREYYKTTLPKKKPRLYRYF